MVGRNLSGERASASSKLLFVALPLLLVQGCHGVSTSSIVTYSKQPRAHTAWVNTALLSLGILGSIAEEIPEPVWVLGIFLGEDIGLVLEVVESVHLSASRAAAWWADDGGFCGGTGVDIDVDAFGGAQRLGDAWSSGGDGGRGGGVADRGLAGS
jgi:hypothetical protein